MPPKLPSRLYKYRDFSARTLELLCEDSLYFADPATFNDPLDCNPTIECDSTLEVLRTALENMVNRRVSDETRAGLTRVSVSIGPNAEEHANRTARLASQRILGDIEYNATEEDSAPETALLTSAIERELMLRYGRGICSLATKFDSPLMWSHYGAEHRGLCIGYAPTKEPLTELHPVAYGGSRNLMTSTIASMVLNENPQAVAQVDEAVLLRKAYQWRYEREWRLLGPRGQHDSTLELVEVNFGMRCTTALMHTVVSALNGRVRPVKFYGMKEVAGTFRLKRFRVDEDDLKRNFPRRSMSAYEVFGAIE